MVTSAKVEEPKVVVTLLFCYGALLNEDIEYGSYVYC